MKLTELDIIKVCSLSILAIVFEQQDGCTLNSNGYCSVCELGELAEKIKDELELLGYDNTFLERT